MNRLANLRSQLALMSWARFALRWLRGITIFVCVILLLLAGLYAIDFGMEKLGFHASVLQRSMILALGAIFGLIGLVLCIVPLLRPSESVVDMALKIEGEQKIDSDLVAALQFESPEAAPWGSRQLQDAVVDYVADWGRGLKVNDGLGDGIVGQAIMALGGLAAMVALWCALAIFSPADIFFQRLALGAIHYPSATKIESVAINGVEYNPVTPQSIKVGQGRELSFKVKASGVLPQDARAELHTPEGNMVPVALARSAEGDGSADFVGALPHFGWNVSYQLYVGDAWTEPAPIELVPLPIVKPAIDVVPPAYAKGAAEREDPQQLQRSVLEGSKVQLGISESSKPLKSASVTIGSGANQQVLAMKPVGATGKDGPHTGAWTLPLEGTPFARIAEPLSFQLQVVDEDGFGLDSPLRGSIRIKADRRPQVTAEIRHRVVVPTASPVVKVRLRDDYGISKMNLVLKIVRTSKGNKDEDHVVPVAELLVAPVAEGGAKPAGSPVPLRLPYTAKQLPVTGVVVLPLATYQMDKGDQLRLALEATDFRGDQPGETSSSEQLVIEITDVSGVLADSAKRDEQAEKSLTDIINLQLGIGDSK